MSILYLLGILAIIVFFMGIRIVRPTHRGLIERLGKYNRFASPGFSWIMPIIENMYQVNTTKQMVDAEPQEIITFDNLNAKVDAQVLRKLETVEKALENNTKIVVPAHTELVNVIGEMAGVLPLKRKQREENK